MACVSCLPPVHAQRQLAWLPTGLLRICAFVHEITCGCHVLNPHRSLDVEYVFVVFGGLIGYPSDDINKFLWMVRLGPI